MLCILNSPRRIRSSHPVSKKKYFKEDLKYSDSLPTKPTDRIRNHGIHLPEQFGDGGHDDDIVVEAHAAQQDRKTLKRKSLKNTCRGLRKKNY